MASLEPASAEPIGAPRPLEKQIETVSKCLRPLPGRDAGGHHGVHQPGSVQMHRQSVLACPLPDRGNALDRVNSPAAAVMGVLQPDQASADVMDVVGADGVFDVVERKEPEVSLEGACRGAGKPRFRRPPRHRRETSSRRAVRLPVACARRQRSGWPSCPTARGPRPPCPADWLYGPRAPWTVGSSPKTSSPTSAWAMARRISGVGRVTVSDLRSIGGQFMGGVSAAVKRVGSVWEKVAHSNIDCFPLDTAGQPEEGK